MLLHPTAPVLKAYLMVATSYLQRNIFVHNACLLEEALAQCAGVRVLGRHEEMSNAVMFYINRWDRFPVPPGCAAPDQGTVSISRRGVVNTRLSWHDGVVWDDNESWVVLIDAIRDFIKELC